ncbi:MAG: YjbQ family protein [Deltaproteobacteria bacterium]|nr:YjbQ family protein [Deltaproteobacteria bacterium]MBI4374050.1 YjbQ family protein [Deltaproteobacteria bacterium]
MFSLKSFYVGTSREADVINIGHDVRGFVRESKIENGLVTVSCRLAGGGIAVLTTEGKGFQAVCEEIKRDLPKTGWRHLLPTTVSVPVENGKLVFEPWQDLYLIDIEVAARRREVVVQLFSEPKEGPQQGGARGGRR